jgi:hypothetical protein
MRIVKPIFKIQPLQADTVQLKPNSAVPGKIGTPTNVVGTALAAKVTLTKNANVQMPDGTYKIVVTVVGAADAGKYKIIDTVRGITTAEITAGATAVSGLIAGVDVKVSDTTSCTVDDYCEFEVVGDQTYIIPGTVLGRVASTGLWEPATDATIANFDQFRVAMDFQETDKSKTVLAHGYENNLSDVYTVDVVVYGQLLESICRGINLTDNLKAKMPFYAWL